jgi:preprotein translocase subunit SecF
MPTSLDDIKQPPQYYDKLSCQEIYNHIETCPVCQKLYASPNSNVMGVVTSSSSSKLTTVVIVAILIIFIGIFIYQKFIK